MYISNEPGHKEYDSRNIIQSRREFVIFDFLLNLHFCRDAVGNLTRLKAAAGSATIFSGSLAFRVERA